MACFDHQTQLQVILKKNWTTECKVIYQMKNKYRIILHTSLIFDQVPKTVTLWCKNINTIQHGKECYLLLKICWYSFHLIITYLLWLTKKAKLKEFHSISLSDLRYFPKIQKLILQKFFVIIFYLLTWK